MGSRAPRRRGILRNVLRPGAKPAPLALGRPIPSSDSEGRLVARKYAAVAAAMPSSAPARAFRSVTASQAPVRTRLEARARSRAKDVEAYAP